MNRNQYYQKHQHLQLDRNELERKYQAHQRELEDQMMWEAAMRVQGAQVAAVSSGGGGNPISYGPLEMTFDDIANVTYIMGDPQNIDDWNVFFDLPAYGTPFTSVEIEENTVRLYGATSIEIRPLLMYDNGYNYILKVIDNGPIVKVIHTDAFSYCYYLTDAVFPVCTDAAYYEEVYDYGCFGECYELTNLQMPLLETAGEYCFTDLDAIETISLPALKSAKRFCFASCDTLKEIDLPSLLSIGDGGFSGCYLLETINLPSCIELGSSMSYNGVFSGIMGNTISLQIPTSLYTDGDVLDLYFNNTVTINGDPNFQPFSGYTGDLNLEFDNITSADALVGDSSNVSDWNTFLGLPSFSTPFTGVTIDGNTVTLTGGENIAIVPSKFSGVGGLIGVEDAGCVAYLGNNCFEFSGLVSVSLDALQTTGTNCFYYCTSLASVSLPLLTTAGYNCFSNCTSLTSVSLPLLTTAGEYCFESCMSLTSASLPLLTTSGFGCFYGCTSLTSVSLPSLTTAGDNCFYNCTSLASISLPLLATAGDSCFYNCTSLVSISLPSLTTAGYTCFNSCTSLASIDLPSLTTVGGYCFYYCTNLTSISLPACTNLGGTVGDDSVFLSITGNIITLTVPAALMTCDAGNPDGDIQYLQANNTVTVVTT